MNKDNTLALIERLRSIPVGQFFMQNFSPSPNDCNTAVCLAGHAYVLATGKWPTTMVDVKGEAMEFLGISWRQAEDLFYCRWPVSIMERHNLYDFDRWNEDHPDRDYPDYLASPWEEGNQDALDAAIETLELMLEMDGQSE